MKLLFSFQVLLLLVLNWHKFYRKHFEGALGGYRMGIFFEPGAGRLYCEDF